MRLCRMLSQRRSSITSLVFTFLLAVQLGACSQSSGIPARPDSLGLDVPKFDIPEPDRWTLDNGLEVYYYYNPELPVMRARLYVHGGSAYDSFDTPGLAAATGSQIREGGAVGYTPDELDEYLDRIAASIESSIGAEYGSVALFSLSEDFHELFPLYASIIRQPRFSEERLSLWKALTLEGIRRRRDNPGTISSMVFNELVYGRGSRLVRFTTPESITSITQATMRAYHAAFFAPQRSRLAISGSLEKAEVREAIEKHFGDWRAAKEPHPLVNPEVGTPATPGVYLVSRPLDQATIRLGHAGPPRHTKDTYDIEVFSEIFGSSGFSSVLFQEVRTRLGLAYSVYGGLFPDFVAGTFQVGLQTQKEQAIAAVQEVVRLAKDVRKELPEETLFREAKTSVERSFVFKFAKPEAIVDRSVLLDTLEYPSDYDASYLENIEAVTPEEIRESAARWIDPERAIVLIVGSVDVDELKKGFPELPIYTVEFETAPGTITQLR